MSYDYDDFWAKPGEFDQLVEDLKETLRNSVKDEIKEKIASLEKELEEIKEFRDEKEKFIWDYHSKLNKMQQVVERTQREAKDAERKWKDARLHELLGDNLTVGWRATFTEVYGKKCDKCDEDRMIHFISPQGRDFSERCECAKCYRTYFPEEVALYKFHVSKRENWPYDKKVDYHDRYYKAVERGDYHEYCESVSEVYTSTDNINYERVNECWAVFLSKEDCQKFCDWKNKQELRK